ncbi:peptidyl-prolylcis-transisomerase [Haloferula helveola]|uniref:Peptidyl-prolyl cis-trans isomerase n=1 Tax=Haloferula helveola TaxID=490095 RepID=A0ABM7RAN1_9BACT|nr:peptidyl-prolylcis-transisomerase [Haloferula helveola]
MKLHSIPGVLALSLAASIPALAQNEDSGKPAATATTPPVEIPTQGGAPAAEPAAEEGAAEAPAAPLDPATVKTDSSYGLGFRTGGEFGQRYGNFGVGPDDLDMESFIKGFLAGFKGDDPELSEEKVGAAMQALGDMLQKREEELATKNLEEGKAFLEANGKKAGVTTLDSGLQYQVINKGGDKGYVAPKEGEPDKQFMVNYKGTLMDGTEFDASPEGETVPMSLEVIDGFKEALQKMPVGAKWKLFIPSELAYADQRRSAEIGPNTVLIFELELVSIEDAPAHPGGLPFPMPEMPEGE